MDAFDGVLEEVRQAPMDLAIEGGSAMLAIIGAAVLKRLGYAPEGKANVSIAVEETTSITITWPG